MNLLLGPIGPGIHDRRRKGCPHLAPILDVSDATRPDLRSARAGVLRGGRRTSWRDCLTRSRLLLHPARRHRRRPVVRSSAVEACPFCGTTVLPGAELCPVCFGDLSGPVRGRAKTTTAQPIAPRPKKKLDLTDRSTDPQAPALQAAVMGEPEPPPCAIHARAKSRGQCVQCHSPACEICLSHGGVCPACRRQNAPARIAEASRDIGFFTALAGLSLIGFALWQELDRTVLDSDLRRSIIAGLLGLGHLAVAPAIWQRRATSFALIATAVCLCGVVVPLLGGEPWWMALVRLGLSGLNVARSLELKRQLDELYLALDRPA